MLKYPPVWRVTDGGRTSPPTLEPRSCPGVEEKCTNGPITVSQGKGKGPGRRYATTETAGCSCEQIIQAQDLAQGHTKHGCRISAMRGAVVALRRGSFGVAVRLGSRSHSP